MQRVIHFTAELPFYATRQVNKYFPSAKISSEITPEYMGVGYITGPRISGILVAGGAIAGVIVAFLMASDSISRQLKKISLENWLTGALGENGYFLLGAVLFALMGLVLYRTGIRRSKKLS